MVTRRLPAAVETRMKELFDVRLNADDEPMGGEELAGAFADSDVVVPTLTDRIDAALVAAAGPRLGLIANFGAGTDHIDVAAAAARGITVTNTPGVLTEDTADMVMALVLAIPRRLLEGERMLRDGRWKRWGPMHMLGHRLGGRRLGIVGMGRVGQAVARRARAFGLAVHYHNRTRLPEAVERELEATGWDSLADMLAHVDIVSVNCPHTPETYRLLSREMLERLQPHAYVVNTSRGEVIDEEALADLLHEGRIAGAGLDVFERAPPAGERLLSAPNTVLLPHMGSATVEARAAMGERVIVNIQTHLDGHRPPDRVIAP